MKKADQSTFIECLSSKMVFLIEEQIMFFNFANTVQYTVLSLGHDDIVFSLWNVVMYMI